MLNFEHIWADTLRCPKANVEAKVGTVVADIHQKVQLVDQSLLQLTEAGSKHMVDVGQQKNEVATRIQAAIGDATTELEKQRTATG